MPTKYKKEQRKEPQVPPLTKEELRQAAETPYVVRIESGYSSCDAKKQMEYALEERKSIVAMIDTNQSILEGLQELLGYCDKIRFDGSNKNERERAEAALLTFTSPLFGYAVNNPAYMADIMRRSVGDYRRRTLEEIDKRKNYPDRPRPVHKGTFKDEYGKIPKIYTKRMLKKTIRERLKQMREKRKRTLETITVDISTSRKEARDMIGSRDSYVHRGIRH